MKAITNAEVKDEYILSEDSIQTYKPGYTFHGFRYVRITTDKEVTITHAKGKVITSVGEQTGFIKTDNKDINKLFSNTLWSQMANYISINGLEVKNGEVNDIFNPGWTDYKYYANYQTYDITKYLNGSEFTLGVELGNGWYAGKIGQIGAYQEVIGADDDKSELALIAKIVIQYEDGTKTIINSESGEWFSSDYSPILENDYFDGETYDANISKEIEGWNKNNYDITSWSGVDEAD